MHVDNPPCMVTVYLFTDWVYEKLTSSTAMSVFTTISIQPPPFSLLCAFHHLDLLPIDSFILQFWKPQNYWRLQVPATLSHMVLFLCTSFPSPLSPFFLHISLPPPSPFLLLLFSLSLPLIGILILPSNLRLKSGEFCLGLTPTGCSIFTVAPLLLALTQVRFNFLNNCMLYFGDCERAPH